MEGYFFIDYDYGKNIDNDSILEIFLFLVISENKVFDINFNRDFSYKGDIHSDLEKYDFQDLDFKKITIKRQSRPGEIVAQPIGELENWLEEPTNVICFPLRSKVGISLCQELVFSDEPLERNMFKKILTGKN